MMTLRVTVDTNVVDDRTMPRLEDAARGLRVEFGTVTVTERELGRWDTPGERVLETGVWNESCWNRCALAKPMPEVFVLGESRLGQAVPGSDEDADIFGTALRIISNGSFPKPGGREPLFAGQRRQPAAS